MPAGLGGGGSLRIALESANGTYVQPTDAATVSVPILNESLKYTEDKYYSPQIREQTIVSDVKQSFYHVEGDIEMEADPRFLPYFLHASRHNIAKSGTGPYIYSYAPSSAGSSSTAASGNVARTASITIVRNGKGFGYAGCVMGGYSFRVENGVLLVTFNVLGLSEVEPTSLPANTWVAPNLLGADAHRIRIDAAGTAPAFAGSPVRDFNGYTFNSNFNATPENRIVPERSATYIAYHETEATIDTELDFIDRVEYDNFVAATTRAIQLSSTNGGIDLTAASSGVEITARRTAYDTYDVGLGGMGDLIMAGVTARVVGIAGADAYTIRVKSASNIA